jgi:ferredoxin-NADP reductase
MSSGALASPTLRWQRALIDAIVPLTTRVTSFFLTLSQPFAFHAGQHVDVRLTAADGYQAQRSYSIASPPAGSSAQTSARMELTIESLDDGEVSPYFHDVAAVGDEIEIRGPIGGHFIWSPDDGGPLLLLGGGSGVVPLMSMIRHRAALRSSVHTLLLFSARSWNDLIFRDELLDLHSRHDGFELILTLTREPERRPGDYARRVDAPMMAEVLARFGAAPNQVFICGANPFVEAAAQGLLSVDIPARIIRTERYGG